MTYDNWERDACIGHTILDWLLYIACDQNNSHESYQTNTPECCHQCRGPSTIMYSQPVCACSVTVKTVLGRKSNPELDKWICDNLMQGTGPERNKLIQQRPGHLQSIKRVIPSLQAATGPIWLASGNNLGPWLS